MISRLSSRSLFRPVAACGSARSDVRSDVLSITPPSGPSLLESSARSQDVDHEVQRVGPLDAGVLVALVAVAEVRRDGEHHPAADGTAYERLVPALHDRADPDLEGRRL